MRGVWVVLPSPIRKKFWVTNMPRSSAYGSDVNRLQNLNRLKMSFNRLIIAINRLIAIKNFNRLID